MDTVICVGGVDVDGIIWEGSSVGDNNGRIWPPMLPRNSPDEKPEVVAPAHKVPVIMPGNEWGLSSGTSAATVYVTAEYSLNGGSSWTVHNDAEEADNLTITNGQTNTSLTVSVPDGSSIQWRYKSSDTSGNWTGLSYITASDMNMSLIHS